MKSRHIYITLLVFVLALAVRIYFAIQSADTPSSDSATYDNLGLSLAQGKGYIDRGGTPHSVYPPLYPIFLAVVYKFFGHNYLPVRTIQSFMGAMSCVLIYVIGKKTAGKTVGIIAMFISAVYPPFVKSSELLLTELFFSFLLLLVIFYLFEIKAYRRLRDHIILGILLGMALLTKSIMLFFPIFIIPTFMNSGRAGFLKGYITVLLFFGLSITPWVVRNYNVYNSFIPASPESGLGLYSSYYPKDGIFGFLPAQNDTILIEAGQIPQLAMRNKFFLKKTLALIINDPKRTLALEFKKILYFWAPLDWEIVGNRWFNFVYVIMLPFFGLGFFGAVKKLGKTFPILMPIIYFQIMTLVFYGSPRFRFPIEPYLFILGAVGILQCWRWAFAGLKTAI